MSLKRSACESVEGASRSSAPLEGSLLPRPALLVSVRSAHEAELALEGGAEWVDVKEPARGPLGRASWETFAAVARRLRELGHPRAATSAALGELRELEPRSASGRSAEERRTWDALFAEGAQRAAYGFYKAGLAGERETDWHRSLDELRSIARRSGADLVAVAYADWERAGAPRPEDVLARAIERRFPYLLIDTCVKDGASLFEHVELAELEAWLRRARAARLSVAFAGSLQIEHAPSLRRLRPDLVAVRGAVTSAGREGELDACAVRRFRRALEGMGRP